MLPTTSSSSPRTRSRWWLVIVAAVFLGLSFSRDHYWDEYFYLFSVRQHSPAVLVALEGALAEGVLPYGFFAGKIGFVAVLWALVGALGDGQRALFVVRLIFAGLVLAFGAATFKLLESLLARQKAAQIALVTLALPLPLYLGFKTLSETPALVLGTLAGWQFVASFRTESAGAQRRRLLAATLWLALGTFCRVSSLLLFVGLMAALLARAGDPVPRRQLIRRGTLVLLAHLLLVAVGFLAVGLFPVDRLRGLVASVTDRQWTPAVRLYGVALFAQLFLLPALVACRPAVLRATRWALVWLGVCLAPFLLLGEYAEPRYFAASIVPLAILAHDGLCQMARRLPLKFDVAFGALFSAIVLVNRLWLAPLMPVELSEGDYNRLMARLAAREVTATYLAPWLSDYCYFSFAFPERRVVLVMSETYGTGKVFETAQFLRWVGPERYAGSAASLDKLPRPWIYVGWSYNPTVVRLKNRLASLGLAGLAPVDERRQLLDHLTPSWIWSATDLRLVPLDHENLYHAFEVLRRDAASAPAADLR